MGQRPRWGVSEGPPTAPRQPRPVGRATQGQRVRAPRLGPGALGTSAGPSGPPSPCGGAPELCTSRGTSIQQYYPGLATNTYLFQFAF